MHVIRITSLYLIPVPGWCKNFERLGRACDDNTAGIIHDIDIWLINADLGDRASMVRALGAERSVMESMAKKSLFRKRFWMRQSLAMTELMEMTRCAPAHLHPGLDFIMGIKDAFGEYRKNIDYGVYLFDAVDYSGR